MPLNVKPFGWQFIDRKDASASATIDFALPAGYLHFKVYLSDVLPATDDVYLMVRTSTDAGVSFDEGITHYRYRLNGTAGTGVDTAANIAVERTSEAGLAIAGSHGFGANVNCSFTAQQSISGEFTIFAPGQSRHKRMHAMTSHTRADGNPQQQTTDGWRSAAALVDAIRFIFESGNITQGEFLLFGLAVPSA